jgi:hypothetical protein
MLSFLKVDDIVGGASSVVHDRDRHRHCNFVVELKSSVMLLLLKIAPTASTTPLSLHTDDRDNAARELPPREGKLALQSTWDTGRSRTEDRHWRTMPCKSKSSSRQQTQSARSIISERYQRMK